MRIQLFAFALPFVSFRLLLSDDSDEVSEDAHGLGYFVFLLPRVDLECKRARLRGLEDNFGLFRFFLYCDLDINPLATVRTYKLGNDLQNN